MTKKYNTKIHILVPGPLNKESWKKELVKCTKDTYYKENNIKNNYIDENEHERLNLQAITSALQYYKIMSYRGFYKKVLGQKIINKAVDETKKSYRKTEEGEYERDVSIDKIENLNNSILIIDEAHNVTGNEYGLAVQKIINNSKNLRIILLTATPMKNLADDIVELINYLRPHNDPIERDKIFNTEKNYKMDVKPEGLEYLQKMTQGYISYYRGMDPLTFAIQKDEGEISKTGSILFTPLVHCDMENFQYQGYKSVKDSILSEDSLERKSAAIANFAIPGIDLKTKEVTALFGNEGIYTIKNQLKTNNNILLETIKKKFFSDDIIAKDILIDNKSTISGLIFKQPYLKNFSIKFDKCLNNLLNLVIGKKGPGTAFIYSNLVRSGIELFEQVLLHNGFLKYNDDKHYDITNDTIEYETGLPYIEYISQYPTKKFNPATFITITGQSEETQEINIEDKTKIINDINDIDNIYGKNIKFILGSKIMNEGITLHNIKEVHVLDIYFNLGKVYQVIGRAIRHCVHYNVTNEKNPYPQVTVYRYCITIPNSDELSSEELLYVRAEKKFLLIKKVERSLKEIAIDCPLNYNGNTYEEEITKYANCVNPLNQKNGDIVCPAICDFDKCDYKCKDKSLNLKYYDNTTRLYKRINKVDLDFFTFTHKLARSEINLAKDKIIQLYRLKYVYTLDQLLENVKTSFNGEKQDLFDPFFAYKAIDELIPITENDFNNFQSIIYDKFNIPGYLIYRNKFYIFQPFNENEDVPMYYRSNYQQELTHEISVKNYLNTILTDKIIEPTLTIYNYDFEYYENKPDFIFVGIIDKESIKKRNIDDNITDIFKIRPSRSKEQVKKRAIGQYSLKGSICHTSKNKQYLYDIANDIGIKKTKNIIRYEICEVIKQRLLFLEKYSTTKSNNKFTYMIIPKNHPIYPFPFNLEDRIENIKNKLINILPKLPSLTIKETTNGIFENIRDKQLVKYIITIKHEPLLNDYITKIEDLGFKNLVLTIE